MTQSIARREEETSCFSSSYPFPKRIWWLRFGETAQGYGLGSCPSKLEPWQWQEKKPRALLYLCCRFGDRALDFVISLHDNCHSITFTKVQEAPFPGARQLRRPPPPSPSVNSSLVCFRHLQPLGVLSPEGTPDWGGQPGTSGLSFKGPFL